MAKFLLNAPPTEEGAKLELTAEMEENCKVVYKFDESGGAAFAGFWNPEIDYNDEFIILPVRSIDGGSIEIMKNQHFANVIGSGDDPKIPDPASIFPYSWIGFYKFKTGITNCVCCAENAIFNKDDNTQITTSISTRSNPSGIFSCGGSIVGGHVTLSKDNKELRSPTDTAVFLLPICDNHNTCGNPPRAGYGTGFYMRVREKTKAVKLIGYFQSSTLQSMLSKESDV